jgi:hypothetical protein
MIYFRGSAVLRIRFSLMGDIRIPLFTLTQIRILFVTLMRIRILLLIQMMRSATAGLQTDPPRLQFEPPQFLKFNFGADLD